MYIEKPCYWRRSDPSDAKYDVARPPTDYPRVSHNPTDTQRSGQGKEGIGPNRQGILNGNDPPEKHPDSEAYQEERETLLQ